MLFSIFLLLTQQFSQRVLGPGTYYPWNVEVNATLEKHYIRYLEKSLPVLGKPFLKGDNHGMFCESSGSSLTWYLNGVKQEVGLGKDPPFMLPVSPGSTSSLSLADIVGENCNNKKSKDKDEELLTIHFPPDSPVSSPHISGLSLLLLLVIQSRPPSGFNFQDQDGRFYANSSRFLLLDTRSVDGNGSLRLKVSTKQSEVSQTSVITGLLSARVELPVLLLIVAGSALVSGILMVNVLVCCLVLKKRRNKYHVGNQLSLSTSNNMKLNNSCLPREHMSLPSNLQLNDLRPQVKGSGNSTCDTQEDVSAPSGTANDSWQILGNLRDCPPLHPL
ncbi:transmembrane protein 25 isoform X3 [Hyla sarda]|uniref:transmembrane protein 25 isoform X3 n=1 Tax=Hyla sarda TaxID=327740 RepID=UPI0024C2A6CE|nr:transmembrane protein 25 isoform X3 [Hyla sarda]